MEKVFKSKHKSSTSNTSLYFYRVYLNHKIEYKYGANILIEKSTVSALLSILMKSTQEVMKLYFLILV